ncbi:LysR family transcriptional regulator [Paraburkholderia rhynchosiae]|uniref:HTH-type transcriptional regulator DmlR n=1 Tax=Paraburkholderia rhynchosiae TaxID=487049 RepID=A0A2N7WLQ4_9BURK|nr:LysR family transcriptional regulator [Paraburkholderia rhynchosiae]PMS30343.1 LysR family transcriptional regulator [Paraburkholderia rhynchosiae]CAB3691638.1 HTH-type transcriptional regulator DmlR [Paraburkholderia rhynchosiae]
MAQVDTFSGILIFVTAAKSRSFTDAAEELGLTKSAVGKAIAKLEDRLGAQLFHRTTRSISLTADGDAYFAACASALDEISTAETALGPGNQRPVGRLRIDMPAAFGRRILVPILLDIARKHPDLQFTMTFSDHLIDPIEEGVDLVIRFGELESSSGLVARRLTSQRMVIAASPDYLAQRGTPTRLEDLKNHSCILGYRRGQPLSWRVNVNGEPHRISPPATYQISDGDSIVEAALAGLGLCQMPMSLLRPHLESGALLSALEDISSDFIDVHAVWPKVAHLRPKVRHVVDTFIELAEQGKLD